MKVFFKDFSVKGFSKMSMSLCGGFAIKYTLFGKLQNPSKKCLTAYFELCGLNINIPSAKITDS